MTRQTISVVSANIDKCTPTTAVHVVANLATRTEGSYVCICNAHSIVTAANNPVFLAAINEAEFATPDGWPVAWVMRRLGAPDQVRVDGPNLMLNTISAHPNLAHFFYGSTETTLELLIRRLRADFPNINIAGRYSPPFRSLSPDEETEVVELINSSAAQIIWVSLGCPKQELWMAKMKGRIRGTMLGVGAAFDYHAGTLRRAPRWMQANGLEWLYRLACEPRRLWKRYLVTNALFVYFSTLQLLRQWR